ncbi:autotransporter outer membrane beta-barrel domain-containing protein, partial [Pelagibacterales bacterium SAG-MED46]|nr:autotransporter outer membrane beta-barrel domain-containing protein [Pelagibacterales bacterium SAG-MED46]
DIGITATAKTASAAGTALNITSNDATGLLQALNSANTASDSTVVTALNNALQQINGSTTATATAAAKQLAPQQDLIVGSSAALKANTGSLQSVMSNRMASLRSGDAYVAGMSAGDGVSANSMFMQAYGSIVQQDDKIVGSGHQSGYDADTAGVAFGVDGITDGGLVMGLSVSMANTDLEGKGTGNAKNDIDSYAASIYMDKTGDAGYVEGSVTFGISENASSRVVNTLGIDRTYKGDYDTQQVSVKIGGGLPYEAQNGAYVTPFASLTGTLIESDAYTETSSANNDALRIRYDQDDINSIVGTIGLKAHYDTGNGVPMISLSVNNEFGDTDVVTTNTYQGGGTAFKTTTAIEEMSATLGLGYTFTNGNTDVNVGVEAEANNDDYFGGYGNVKVTSRF